MDASIEALENLSILVPFEGNNRYQWHTCANDWCPNIFKLMISSDQRYCPECQELRGDMPVDRKRERVRESDTRKRGLRGWNNDKRWKERWILLYDPTPYADGGIQHGAAFETLDFLTSLQGESWAPGTCFEYREAVFTVKPGGIIKRQDGALFRAVNNNRLERINDASNTDNLTGNPRTDEANQTRIEAIPYWQRTAEKRRARAQAVREKAQSQTAHAV